MHGSSGNIGSAGELAARRDFDLGGTTISPSTRLIRGPGGETTVEPRVMQVLLVLADAAGSVVTRDALLRQCWNGQFVGDEALNRAVGEVRRVARAAAAGGFAVETIPKTGYRLVARDAPGRTEVPSPPPVASGVGTSILSRRLLIGGGAFALAGIGGVVAWRARDPRADRTAALIERGELALRDGLPEGDAQGVGFLREALVLDPDNARGWGKLALALRYTSEYAVGDETAAAVRGCEAAARRALMLDPDQPDAAAALATLPPHYGDWQAAERRFTALLARHPGNPDTTTALAMLNMETGRVAAAARLHATLAAREPLSPVYQYRHVYGLWATGRLGEADRVADRALSLWPRHIAVWLARLWTLAFTGRPAQALAMTRTNDAIGDMMPPLMVSALHLSLAALSTRAPDDIAAAVAANLTAAGYNQTAAINAILLLSGLGAVDAAFDVAHGYLLRRGPIAVELRRLRGEPSVNDQRRRKTMMLWVPVTAPLRADPRFFPLCEEMGMADYWRATGARPDYLGTTPLPV